MYGILTIIVIINTTHTWFTESRESVQNIALEMWFAVPQTLNTIHISRLYMSV